MANARNKTRSKKSRSAHCLNLRQVQEARQAQLLRAAKGLVDLTAAGEEYSKKIFQPIENKELITKFHICQ